MTAERRAAMGGAAIEVAKAVGYVGAGTVEFIVSPDGAYYFMEMNTRLQVEHPVTEMITGLDLVEWQLCVAAGEPLPLVQEQLKIHGHAIEARLYAEDPGKGFLPSTGRLVYLAPPEESLHVRVDTGVEQGDEISSHYDPMIAKLIVWDESRERALARMLKALADYRVVGVANNVEFLSRLVACPAFAQADLDTGLIEREQNYLFPESVVAPDEAWQLAALAELLFETHRASEAASGDSDPHSPWHCRDGWRVNGAATRTLTFRLGEALDSVDVAYAGNGFALTFAGNQILARGQLGRVGLLRAELGGRRLTATVIAAGERRHVFLNGCVWPFAAIDALHQAREGSGAESQLVAPMPGKVVALLVRPGTRVDKGAPLLVLEAMKMEHTITAPAAGLLKAFRYAAGEQVADGAELVEFEITKRAK
jgi:3-methylcrotonyl-CoA carboxylase alpha subunit